MFLILVGGTGLVTTVELPGFHSGLQTHHMNTAPAFLSWALSLAPVPSTTDATGVDDAPTVEASEYTSPAGHRTRWASAKYVLPDGKIAEVFITADDTASGEATISVDGEAIVSSNYDPATGVTSWTSPEPGAGDLAAAAMTAIAERGGGDLLDAFLPDEPQMGPCSETTKKWVKVAKYAWYGVIGSALGACCLGASIQTGGAACVACGGLAGVAMGAGGDIADDYCS